MEKTEERRPGRGRYRARKGTNEIHPATGCRLKKDEVYLIEHKRAGKEWFAPVTAKAPPKVDKKPQEVKEK